MSGIRQLIKEDLFRYHGLKGMRGFIRGLYYPGFRYTLVFRIASMSNRYSPLRLFCEIMKRRYMFKYGFQIPSSTSIGKGFYIGHVGPIVINKRSKIGDYCNLTHNVTIGQANRGRLKGYPKLGDKVWIGTGSVIVGNISIGSNVLIAPNTYVNFDIPDNSLVIGNPASIKTRLDATEGYINYILDQ